MTLTLGAQHVCTGTGSVAVSTPLGVRVTLSLPAWAAVDPGTPGLAHRVGAIALGTSLGDLRPLLLEVSPQLVYPLPEDITKLSWTLAPGVTATVDEIVRPAGVVVSAEPWDRNPAALTQSAGASGVGPTSSTLWTYTVPTGRKLLVASAQAYMLRITAFTGANFAIVSIKRGGIAIAQKASYSNVLGDVQGTELNPSGLVLLPGEVISATWNNAHTGGNMEAWAFLTGLLFDA